MPDVSYSFPREVEMIPMSKDVAELIGNWAEGVENRSLLHEKFGLPKVWGEPSKVDDAARWSVLRIVTRGADLLRRDAQRLRDSARRSANPEKADKQLRQAEIADKMANTAPPESRLSAACIQNAQSFLQQLNHSYGGSIATFEATLGGRVMINLAGGVIENAGISLDRCFGLPLIPGSAVKGITRAHALWEIKEASAAEKDCQLLAAMLLFGYGANDVTGDFAWAAGLSSARNSAREIGAEEFKGCACFLPAYPTTLPTLAADMVNPHYPQYYSGRAARAEDSESPLPNYFPAVEAGSTFGFAVLLNRAPHVPNVTSEGLLGQARLWLEDAVTRRGVGAKTAAGYGWFELGRVPSRTAVGSPTAEVRKEAVRTTAATPATEVVTLFKSLANKDNFPGALPRLAALDDANLRQAFESLVPANERKRLRKNSPYWQAFTSGRAGTSGQQILARLGLKLS